jgi:hypothetical protein
MIFYIFGQGVRVRDHKGLCCNVALIKCTLDSGKPKGGWDFGREGSGGQMGNRGS